MTKKSGQRIRVAPACKGNRVGCGLIAIAFPCADILAQICGVVKPGAVVDRHAFPGFIWFGGCGIIMWRMRLRSWWFNLKWTILWAIIEAWKGDNHGSTI